MMTTSILIFALTYIIIAGRRSNFIKIGRPAGVMLGTILMVASKVIKPAEVYNLINWDTVLLLLGMMIIIEHLSEANFFQILAQKISLKNYSSKKLLAFVVFGLGILAAFFVNDIVCIFFTPILIIMIQKRNLPPMPFIIALATSTNIGGVIAYTGTPQNMIIGNLSGIPYSRYFLLMAPIGLICLAVNYFMLLLIYKKDLNLEIYDIKEKENIKFNPRLKRSIFIMISVILGFFIFDNIAWVAISGASFLLLFANRDEADLLKKLDWNLLLFFVGLFAVVGGLKTSGAIDLFIDKISILMTGSTISVWLFGLFTIIGSNLFANVPYVLVISESIKTMVNPELMWITLAFTSTIAGNLTIIGAVANIIVIERARHIKNVSFMDFFNFGFPVTIIVFITGMLLLTLYSYLGIL